MLAMIRSDAASDVACDWSPERRKRLPITGIAIFVDQDQINKARI